MSDHALVRIETTSGDLRRALTGLVDLMHEAGADFHPGLRIVETDGQLSAWADGDDPWLMRIPHSTLVPVEGVTWADEPPLRVVATPDHLTPQQVEVLEACTAVMAAAGTWERFCTTHPRATITDADAISLIRSLHPPFSPATSAAAMLRTRTIKLRLNDQQPTSYLMPMLDLVNHHPDAPAYPHDGDFLCIGTWRAAPNGECFVSYGSTRDALGIALAYGYVETAITRANALPGEYAMPGGASLRLLRASALDFTHEPDVLTIIGAAWDAADPRVEQQTLIEPIERHLQERGAPAMQARHQARVLSRRVLKDDVTRLGGAQQALPGIDGCQLVVRAVTFQRDALLSMKRDALLSMT
jgi:hypothetical protein